MDTEIFMLATQGGRDEVVAPSREVLVRLNVIYNGLKSSSQDAIAAVLNHPEVEFGDQVTSTNELTAIPTSNFMGRRQIK